MKTLPFDRRGGGSGDPDARQNDERKAGVLAFRISHPKQHPSGRKDQYRAGGKASDPPPRTRRCGWWCRSGKKGARKAGSPADIC